MTGIGDIPIVRLPRAAHYWDANGIVLSPAAGAALMSLPTVIVSINARLLGRADRGLSRREERQALSVF